MLSRLRRRAVNALFYWLGLDQIPRQVWPILDELQDPGLAVARLAEALGCDPLRIRQRNEAEIEELRLGINHLVALNGLRTKLKERQCRTFEFLLFLREHDTTRKKISELWP